VGGGDRGRETGRKGGGRRGCGKREARYQVVVTFESEDEILTCHYFNESFSEILSYGDVSFSSFP